MIDLDELERLAKAATPGPWHWAGNTDTGEPYLATWTPGAGRVQVLSIGHEERTEKDPGADSIREYLRECGGYDEETIEAEVDSWTKDGLGSPVREPRLQFVTDLMCVNAREHVVYEVARNATSRDDPKVYRADIVGIRHPDAEFIAAANPDAIKALFAERDAALARIAELEAGMERCEGLKAAHMRSDHETGKYNEELLARIAEAAELHHSVVRFNAGSFTHDAICNECELMYPCPTAVSLGLNGGGNDE